MFRRKKKAANRGRRIDPAIPPVVTNVPRDYFDLSPEDRRDFLRGILEGMSPNPEVRAQAEETKKKFVERGKNDDRD
jgi:hypothetical protein